MAIQTVKTGAAVNDGTGDDARTAFTKINANFTDNANAASRLVGTAAGNVMGVGAFGVGVPILMRSTDAKGEMALAVGNFALSQGVPADVEGGALPAGLVTSLPWVSGGASTIAKQLFFGAYTSDFKIRERPTAGAAYSPWRTVYHTGNTTKDANGFIKGASPIVRLYADSVECNDEAKPQDITFEKLGVGDYLIKGSTGFAQEGWYIEMPKDANGNVLVAVVYEQLDNNDISVKTYDYMLNKKGRIVPDLKTPLDIPEARWIDIRLQELPQTDVNPADETVATDA